MVVESGTQILELENGLEGMTYGEWIWELCPWLTNSATEVLQMLNAPTERDITSLLGMFFGFAHLWWNGEIRCVP